MEEGGDEGITGIWYVEYALPGIPRYNSRCTQSNREAHTRKPRGSFLSTLREQNWGLASHLLRRNGSKNSTRWG
jgi:hypothetical protein